MNKNDRMRMIQWFLFAAMFYVAAVFAQNPQLQTGLWKAGHITSGAFIGYWIDRHLFGRLTPADDGPRMTARALIVAASMLGMAFGL